MKKLIGIVLIITLIGLSGCETTTVKNKQETTSSVSKQSNSTTDNQSKNSNDKQTEEHTTTSKVISETKTIPELTISEAKKIALKGANQYFNVLSLGFSGCYPPDSVINYNGKDYSYFCPKLDTMEKFHKYLDDAFTREIQDKITQEMKVIEYKGKIAALLTGIDYSDRLTWDAPEVKLLERKENITIYQFTLDGVDGSGNVFPLKLDKKITFKYVQGQDWRMDSDPRETYIKLN